jgi:hypothetical protein
MASVGGPFQSGHGPVERAGVMNFVGRERANLVRGNRDHSGGAATILHSLGLDHKKLTFRFQSRDFRLTDVQGELVTKLLA